MPTIKEVSELAGVSLATVSRVMNNSQRVKEATKKKVRAAMSELGYQPNSAAQSLASNRSNTIGMVVAWLDGAFYGPVMSGVEEELRAHNKHLIIASGHGNAQQEKDAVDYLRARQVDGLILLTDTLDADYLKNLSTDVPIYLMNQQQLGFERRNMALDNEGGSYDATCYLIEQGHTEIACISGQAIKQDARERVAGYQRAMKQHGLPYTEDHIVHSVFNIPGGLAAMNELAKNQVRYSAVVAGSDEMAFGAYEWAESKGLKIPQDFSVIGFDDHPAANFVSPKLTTMHYPAFDMAKTCALMAVNEIYGKVPPKGAEFRPTLIERQSVLKIN